MDSKMKVRIVPMNADHLDEAAALERMCFPDPWSRNMLAEELDNDLAAFLVALDGRGAVAGYAGMQVVLDEGYILNIAVRPDCRRRGVGGQLLQVFLDFARGNRLAFLTLEVRASNRAAIALYESRGFRRAGRRRNYYERPREDAVIMTLAFPREGGMELRLATPEETALAYERDMKAAFPPAELKPLAQIQAMCREGRCRPWCLFEGEALIGECFLWLGRPGWALLDYLCVTEGRRNTGAGALMLALLGRAEPETVILGESEAPDHAPDGPLAKRRLGFYARNGFRTAGYDTEIFGVHYKTLYQAPEPVPDGELMRQHRYIYQSAFPPEKYERHVRIPRDPGASPGPQVPWN